MFNSALLICPNTILLSLQLTDLEGLLCNENLLNQVRKFSLMLRAQKSMEVHENRKYLERLAVHFYNATFYS